MINLQAVISILVDHWPFLGYLLSCQFGFGLLVWLVLRDLCQDSETCLALSFSGGLLGFCLFCLSTTWFHLQPSLIPGLLLLAGALVLSFLYGPALLRTHFWGLLKLLAFFAILLGLRLLFIHNLLVPPYADSVQHVQIVQDMLHPVQPPQAFFQISLSPKTYYHFGFHALAAWLAGSTNTTAAETVMLLGQYFQTMAVLSIFPLARTLLKTSAGAWGAMLICALLLPMPAYASNWGKYPAIASLTGMGFCLGLFATLINAKRPGSIKHWILLSIAIFSTLMLHSRQLMIFLIALVIYWVFSRFVIPQSQNSRVTQEKQFIAICMVLLLSLSILFLIINTPSYYYVFLLVLILGAGAVYYDYDVALGVMAFAILIIFLGGFPYLADFLPKRFEVLMDPTFQKIILFLPLGLLAWLGLEGIAKFLLGEKFKNINAILLLFIVFVGVINISFFQDQHPSPCCVFMNDDDLFSFEWMKLNLPPHTLVGVSATGESRNYQASDGGAWAEMLAGFPTRKIAYDTNFEDELMNFCQHGLSYYYAGGMENSFDEYSLTQAGAHYIFGLGKVRIYSVNCPK